MRCKVIYVVRALKYIAGFDRKILKSTDEEVRTINGADFATKHCARLCWKG